MGIVAKLFDGAEIYPIKAHSSVYNAIQFFHHFDCQVLVLLFRKKKSLQKNLHCHGNKTVSFIKIICGFD